ncbi:MAG TPA: hypothetical protein VJU59_48670, partial [Paraburkholderia sp.]|uniref:hypothetical protein n=1 Tax=Paraburkholderia sp. TaxID=1926495 RepID=UPI002B4679D5
MLDALAAFASGAALLRISSSESQLADRANHRHLQCATIAELPLFRSGQTPCTSFFSIARRSRP